jgi:hypothetical protein
MINFNNIFMSRYATNKTCPLLTKYGLQQYISVKIVSHPYVHHSDWILDQNKKLSGRSYLLIGQKILAVIILTFT